MSSTRAVQNLRFEYVPFAKAPLHVETLLIPPPPFYSKDGNPQNNLPEPRPNIAVSDEPPSNNMDVSSDGSRAELGFRPIQTPSQSRARMTDILRGLEAHLPPK